MTRVLAAGALALLLVALGWAVASGLRDDGTAAPAAAPPVGGTVATTAAPKQAKPRAATPVPFVKLTAVGAFDPEGDGHERDEEAPLAVDGKQSTFWRTERYTRFFKSGVGLVLDAGKPVRVRQVVVTSPTPGIRAEIRLGSAPTGPFTRVSASKTLSAKTTFAVPKRSGRYVVVWITALPPSSAGEVSEVRVRGR
jgi:hypothetical protein